MNQSKTVCERPSTAADFDLAHGHGLQGGVVGGDGHTGRCGCVHRQGYFGEMGFEEQRVGNHADVGAKTAEFHREVLSVGQFFENLGQIDRAEGSLLHHGASFACSGGSRQGGKDTGIRLPTVGPLDAVRNGEVLPLCGIHVVGRVGVQRGHKDAVGISGTGLDFGDYVVHNGHGLGRTQRAVHKVLLHIDNDEEMFHVLSFFIQRTVVFSTIH